MRKKRVIALFSAFVLAFSTVSVGIAEEEKLTFYVSVDGSEDATGTIDDPFESIEQAKDKIAELKREAGLPKGGVCVYVRGGEYFIDSGMIFNEEDSGTAESPITYRAYPNEEVNLIGGYKLRVSDFRRVADETVLKRVYDARARECIFQYDLSRFTDFEYGKVKYTKEQGNKPNELVVDGEIMTIARWPNMSAEGNDIFQLVETVVNTSVPGKGIAFSIADTDRVNNWATATDMRLVANWVYLWASYDDKVDNIKNGVITTLDPSSNGRATLGTARFYANNLLEELDQPGEFFVDTENQIVYLYPPTTATSESSIYISTLLETMFTVKNASYLTFRDFNIPCSRGCAFSIEGGEHNLVAYCKIKNLGSCPIYITGGTYNGAVGNVISDSDGGISVSGGDRNTLTPGNNYAENNDVSKFSRITKTYLGGIHVSGCGNIVSNNEIHDGLHLGMQFAGNENIIEYNEFYDLLQSVDDSGGIYAGDTWVWRGNRIRNNYFHDFYGSSGGVGLGCIYFDDNLSGNSVTGNIFHNVPGRGMWAEAGSDNNIENNIMINVGTPIRYANRGNITTKFSEIDDTAKKKWTAQEVPITSKVWLEKYPILKNLDNEQVFLPSRVTIKNNVFVGSGAASIEDGVADRGTVENNISVDDPGFVDLKNGDFTLKEDASIYSKLPEFEDVHFEKMGRYTLKLGGKISDVIVLGTNKAGAFANGEFKQIDSGNMNVMPRIINSRTMVPVRFISENLEAQVNWNADTREITITKDGLTIKMTIDSNIMTVNGSEVTLDSPPTIIENRTLVPLRAISEALNKKVFWDNKGLIVIGENEAIFDSEADAYMIDDLLRRINLR